MNLRLTHYKFNLYQQFQLIYCVKLKYVNTHNQCLHFFLLILWFTPSVKFTDIPTQCDWYKYYFNTTLLDFWRFRIIFHIYPVNNITLGNGISMYTNRDGGWRSITYTLYRYTCVCVFNIIFHHWIVNEIVVCQRNKKKPINK